MKKILSTKKLLSEAKKFLNLRDVKKSFRSPPDFRSKLTDYQARKIRRMIREVKNALGARADDIVPIGRGRKKFLIDNGYPVFARGVDLPGGEKINSDVHYTGGKLFYTRGNERRIRTRIYTDGTEDDLIKSVKDILRDKPRNWRTSITASGRVIGSAQNLTNKAAITEALYIWHKYSDMAGQYFEQGEDGNYMRARRNKDGTTYLQKVAHPSEWGMGILFEQKLKGGARHGKRK